MANFGNTLDFARQLDAQDQLTGFRSRFFIPLHENREVAYFCGNSLGLQPKTVADNIQQELDDWKNFGVEAHFQAKNPWFSYHALFEKPLSRIVGAQPSEIVAMNSLTVNLHLMMVSFYRPTSSRFKIICEAGAFPSDQYSLESQVRFHGFNPDEAIIEIQPREGEHTLRTEDILTAIEKHSKELALVMFSGVNYYTGQVFDMPKITEAGHKAGAYVGFDLAHAAGNIPLNLHDWNVDFAVWCSYKYLNSCAGGVAGAFVHERHGNNPEIPRFAGWWGYDQSTRFQMKKGFKPMQGASGWQLSNAPILSMAAHKASLDIFDETDMLSLRRKSEMLTGFLEFVIQKAERNDIEIITPAKSASRGCQISLLCKENGRTLFEKLASEGIIVDWREPNVIRVAPVPLYNSFEDVFRLGEVLSRK